MGKKIKRYHMAKSKRTIKFIYFDVGGVLLDFSGSIVRLASVLDKPVDEVREFWAQLDEELNRNGISADEFWGRIKSKFSYSGPDVDITDLWVKGFRPIPETHSFARKISATHAIGILSNAMPKIIREAARHGHIPKLQYAAIIESHAVGFAKPDPEIYALAHKKAGVEAGEILLIDDREVNLPEARKSGFHTYLFDPENPSDSIAELEEFLNL